MCRFVFSFQGVDRLEWNPWSLTFKAQSDFQRMSLAREMSILISNLDEPFCRIQRSLRISRKQLRLLLAAVECLWFGEHNENMLFYLPIGSLEEGM